MAKVFQAAHKLAELGYHVLPLRPAQKTPASRHGEKNATTDVETIRRWFEENPELNIGIATGPSQLLVIDVDPRNGGLESLQRLREIGVVFPDTVRCKTPSGGYHLYYWRPGDLRIASRIGLMPGIDIKAVTGYVGCPPSVLEGGGSYEWAEGRSVFDWDPVETPESLLVILSSDEAPLELPPGSSEIDKHEPATDVSPLPRVGKVPVGRRNIALTSLAGTLRRRGCDAEEIFHHLQFINRRRCEEPLSVQELEKIASGVHHLYPPTDPVGQMDVEESPPVWSPPAADRPASLREVHDAYEKLLPGADHRALRFTLSGYSANYLEAPPLFTLLIGIPSSGKTMTLRALSELPCIQMIDHLTPASLLPGTPLGKRSGESGGGLLLKPREFRIMITEDLRGPLSMGNGPRTKLFGMLSRIYDGELERAVGTGGGLTLHWKGKRGLLGAATPAIYRHHRAVLELGPRFLFLRLNSTRRRGEQPSPEGLKADTEELARTTRRFYSTLDVLAYPEYGRSCRSYLMGLADLASSIRVPAEEGAEIPRGEMPHRLMHQLETYLRGSLATGYSLEETLEDIREIALSTVPPGYRCLLRTLSTRGPMTQAELAKELRISAGAISKMCQRLRALKLIRRSNRRIHLKLPLLQLLTTPCDNGSLEAMDELVVGE